MSSSSFIPRRIRVSSAKHETVKSAIPEAMMFFVVMIGIASPSTLEKTVAVAANLQGRKAAGTVAKPDSMVVLVLSLL